MISHPPVADILDRVRGAFVGLAVGDSLGAPVEFMTSHEIRAKYGVLRDLTGGGWLRLKAGQVTDDTEMSLCIARAVAASGGWSPTAVAEQFATWLKGKPADVGDTCRRGIRNYLLKGQLETPFNQWDAGNGAAMRMAPVAILTLGDDLLLERYGIEQAHITHNHPLSDAACLCLGRLTHLAVFGRSKSRLRREVEELVANHEAFRFEPYRGLATGYVVDTLQTVCHYFFRTAGFEECLVGTVNQGGDADTTGAIAGMIAGAYYGLEQIPRRWSRKLDKRVFEEVVTLADRLMALSPYAAGAKM